MKRIHFVFAIGGAALLSLVAYYLFHLSSTTSESNPNSDKIVNESPTEVPSSSHAPEIKTEEPTPKVATDSVVDPVVRFRKLHLCYYTLKALTAAKKSVAQCKFYDAKPEYQSAYAACLNNLGDASNRISAGEKAMAGCGNVVDLRNNYYNATRTAAKTGDHDAQLCYLQSDFLDAEGKPHYTDQGIADYKADAPEFMDDALKRGDWRIVYLLTTQHFHPTSGYLNLLDDIGQPSTTYKMDALLRLGSSGDYATDLDALMSDLSHRPQVSQTDVAEGDAWAQQVYDQYFRSVPGLEKPPVVCELSDAS